MWAAVANAGQMAQWPIFSIHPEWTSMDIRAENEIRAPEALCNLKIFEENGFCD